MRPPHGESPKQSRKAPRSENFRQKQERNAGEIIRFVRELQCERQPSSICFQKKVPLPGIGHTCAKSGTSDSGFLDRAVDMTDSDSDSFDNEIVRVHEKKPSRKIDPFFIEVLTCPRGKANTSNDYNVLSRSLSHHPQDMYNNNITRTSKQASFIRHGSKHTKGNNGMVHVTCKQLPPLSRDTVPERPSAPSPSRTPPTSDYGYIEEEPVDYLDLS